MTQLITTSQKELSKYEIIKNLISKTVNGSQAATTRAISETG